MPSASSKNSEPSSHAPGWVVTYRFRAMGGNARILLPGPETTGLRGIAQRAMQEVLRIEAKYSRYRPDSVVSGIAAAAGHRRVACDEETMRLLRLAGDLHRLSEGRFDITSGVYRRAWDFRQARLPSEELLASLRPLVGWEQVVLEEDGVYLPKPGMELDLGGFGKEYAADRAAAVLRTSGATQALVDLAGDLVAVGSRPDGSPWAVGIQHPRRAHAVIAEVPLVDAALATSGDYERFIDVDGRRYSHILDTRSGWPVRCWQSASVIAKDCLSAGFVSTLLLLLGDEATAWQRLHRVHGFFIDANGNRVTSGSD